MLLTSINTVKIKKNALFLNNSGVHDLFFLSKLHQKFVSKITNYGYTNKVEKTLFFAILTLSSTKIFKKPFFFIFFHLFEKLSINYTLFAKRRGRRTYFIPAPIHFNKRYKKALQFSKSFFSTNSNGVLGSNNTFNKEKIIQKTFFFFLAYLFKNKNSITLEIHEFKKKIKKNRIFAHWRWR